MVTSSGDNPYLKKGGDETKQFCHKENVLLKET